MSGICHVWAALHVRRDDAGAPVLGRRAEIVQELVAQALGPHVPEDVALAVELAHEAPSLADSVTAWRITGAEDLAEVEGGADRVRHLVEAAHLLQGLRELTCARLQRPEEPGRSRSRITA